jgi:type IV secretory pathway TrbF-like protein
MSDLVFNTAAEIHPNGATPDMFAKFHAQLKEDLRVEKRRTRNWQIHAGVLAVIALAAIGSTYRAFDKIITHTYLVEVAESGQVRNIGLLPEGFRGHPPAVIDKVLQGWLYNMRRVGLDPVQNEEHRHEAGNFMTMAAIRLPTSQQVVLDAKELEKKGMTTQIKILSSIPMTPDARVMQLEWQETTITRQGAAQPDVRWRVIVNVVIYAEKDLPKDLKERKEMRNHIGIFVEDYAWQPL